MGRSHLQAAGRNLACQASNLPGRQPQEAARGQAFAYLRQPRQHGRMILLVISHKGQLNA